MRILVVSGLLLTALSATWNGFAVGGLKISDFFLLAVLGVVAITATLGSLIPRLAGWWWIPVMAIVVCAIARYLSPVPPPLLAIRYPAAAGGLSDIVKAVLWSLSLVGVPLAITGCAALDRRVPRWTAFAFLAGVVVSGAVSLSDLAGLTRFGFQFAGYTDIANRQNGLTNHPNTLGFTCVLAAPIAVYLLAENRYRVAGALALVVLLGGTVASGSRGAQAAIPVAIILAANLSPRRRTVFARLAILAIPVGLGAIVYVSTVPVDTRQKLLRFSGAGGGSKSDSERSYLAHQALSDLREFPAFGVGFSHINEAHSIYLQVLSAGGLVAATALGIYFLMVLRTAWFVRGHDAELASALFASVVMWLALGAIQNQLTDRYLYITVGCIAALAHLARADRSARLPEHTLVASTRP